VDGVAGVDREDRFQVGIPLVVNGGWVDHVLSCHDGPPI
jgi:hypothetical protein